MPPHSPVVRGREVKIDGVTDIGYGHLDKARRPCFKSTGVYDV